MTKRQLLLCRLLSLIGCFPDLWCGHCCMLSVAPVDIVRLETEIKVVPSYVHVLSRCNITLIRSDRFPSMLTFDQLTQDHLNCACNAIIATARSGCPIVTLTKTSTQAITPTTTTSSTQYSTEPRSASTSGEGAGGGRGALTERTPSFLSLSLYWQPTT